ncbi:hypothetical protein WN51_04417 [Melipona quadrifasciata]|uniref:Uncharacterized protein n=1 Tax=Melipona quadrifasciata TaxID=166423 RepID=A0A0M8ZRY8_9HYME|nr:hypothetical protein WN51_04417 [Melipona quadrifasciata]
MDVNASANILVMHMQSHTQACKHVCVHAYICTDYLRELRYKMTETGRQTEIQIYTVRHRENIYH